MSGWDDFPLADEWDQFPLAEKQPTTEMSARSGPRSWGQVASEAASNLLPSAGQLAVDTAQPFLHPMETAGNLHKVFSGLGAKFGYGDKANEPVADAVGQFFKERYGGMENIKNTIATDPVGALADTATVLTGGGAGISRLPGVTGKVGVAINTAGHAIDPFTNAGRVVKGAGNVGASTVGMLTGTGGQAIKTAAKAGYEGGAQADALINNMRGYEVPENVVSDAKGAIASMRADRGAEYRADMANLPTTTSRLSFGPIDTAFVDASKIHRFRGEDLSPSIASARKEIGDVIDTWKKNAATDPAFQTVEGFDALKKRIGDIKDSQPFNTPQRAFANQVYASVRDSIVKQAPSYAKTMKGYEKASALIESLEKTLSLGKKANTDTALRKLQSVMRNNVNTNYGYRTGLAQVLAEKGAPQLMEKLAGQALNTWTPRGLQQLTAGGNLLAVAGGLLNPKALALLPLSSPRVVGEAAYYGGKAAKLNPIDRKALIAALMAGRLNVEE